MMPPFRRRESWASPHERARTRAAERLWEVLDAGEAQWLDRHLAECRDCRAVADAYMAERRELRSLREQSPVPPRDLWARTSAAIEREESRRRPSLRPERAGRTPILHRRRPSPVPLGAIAGVLVVAVVVGVSLLGGRQPSIQPLPSSSLVAETRVPQSSRPLGTPIAVAAGDVGYVKYGPNGQIDVYFSPIDEVCAEAEGPDCAPIDEPTPRSGEPLTESPPKAVVMSPTDKQLVVVQAQTDDGSGKVVVVPVPTAPGSTPDPTPSPAVTPVPPSDAPTPQSETPTPPSETPTPPESPTPTPASGPLEIASDVIVVGQAAAYSADGAWFAFSARPSDGSHGPDIYVWRVGDAESAPITDDHRSVFSGWLDGRLLGSRPVVDSGAAGGTSAAGGDVRPEAFLVDPETGSETILDAAPFWRPSVDPTGMRAVYWDGTLTLAENGFDWRPATGRLVLGAWPPVPAESETPGSQGPASEAPASEEPSTEPSASPSEPATRASVLDSAAIVDWDARWDESGSHLAVWIADAADTTIGRLSLYVVDPATGAIDLDKPLLESKQALPGFSIGSGRLAWATTPGQNGKGSHVEVLAWTKDASGTVESAPGTEQVVVIR